MKQLTKNLETVKHPATKNIWILTIKQISTMKSITFTINNREYNKLYPRLDHGNY